MQNRYMKDYFKEVKYMSKFEIPKDKDEIKKQIKALQNLLPIDDKKRDTKSKQLHQDEIKALKKALSVN